MFSRDQENLLWPVVRDFHLCLESFETAYRHFQDKVDEFARHHRTEKEFLTLTVDEIGQLFNFKELEGLRDGPLFALKENSHRLFRFSDFRDKFDIYVSDIYHELSILKEEHYRSLTYAPQYKGASEVEVYRETLKELNQGMFQRTAQLRGMFTRAKTRLDELYPEFCEVKTFIRALYLFGERDIREARDLGLASFYEKVYPKTGAFEGYFRVARSFLQSRFYEEAKTALHQAKGFLPGKDRKSDALNMLLAEYETCVGQVMKFFKEAAASGASGSAQSGRG